MKRTEVKVHSHHTLIHSSNKKCVCDSSSSHSLTVQRAASCGLIHATTRTHTHTVREGASRGGGAALWGRGNRRSQAPIGRQISSWHNIVQRWCKGCGEQRHEVTPLRGGERDYIRNTAHILLFMDRKAIYSFQIRNMMTMNIATQCTYSKHSYKLKYKPIIVFRLLKIKATALMKML